MTNFGLSIGDYCRLKAQPDYGIAKILRFCKVNNYLCAECEWTTGMTDVFGLIKIFKLRDLRKILKGASHERPN